MLQRTGTNQTTWNIVGTRARQYNALVPLWWTLLRALTRLRISRRIRSRIRAHQITPMTHQTPLTTRGYAIFGRHRLRWRTSLEAWASVPPHIRGKALSRVTSHAPRVTRATRAAQKELRNNPLVVGWLGLPPRARPRLPSRRRLPRLITRVLHVGSWAYILIRRQAEVPLTAPRGPARPPRAGFEYVAPRVKAQQRPY